MGIKESLEQAVQMGQMTSEEAEQRLRQHEENADQFSHLKEGHLFSEESSRHGKLLVVGESDPFDVAAERAKGRRVDTLNTMVMESLVTRVQDPHGPDVMKVSWKEFEQMRQDPEFQSFATYAAKLMFYCDESGTPDTSKPRNRPIRPLLQNEVGMWRNHIVCLKDAGPDDVGEGKYHTVHAGTPLKGDESGGAS